MVLHEIYSIIAQLSKIRRYTSSIENPKNTDTNLGHHLKTTHGNSWHEKI